MKIDGTENQQISSISCDTKFSIYGDYIYFSNLDDSGRIYRFQKDGQELEQITQDKNAFYPMFQEGHLLYILYDESMEYVNVFMMAERDGSGAVEITL